MFLVSLIVSAISIYVVTKPFREEEGMMTALLAALVGTMVYAVIYCFPGGGFCQGPSRAPCGS